MDTAHAIILDNNVISKPRGGLNIHTYMSLFLVTGVAFISPWLSIRMFRGFLPAVILEIIMGYIIGPHGLNWAITTPNVEFLAGFGFSYLMFLSGIELDFDLIFLKSRSHEKPPWLRGGIYFLATFTIATGVAIGLYMAGIIHDVFIVALILSSTSVGIVTPALKEKGWLGDPFGQEMLVYSLISDVFTLILFSSYITLHTAGNSLSVLLILVILLVFVIIYRILRTVLRWDFLSFVENATSEVGLRGSFALILAFLALSKTLGTEVVIGAFLAGTTISLLSEKHSNVTKKLDSIGYGFLLPIFFVNIGMKFNLGALNSSYSFWPMLITAIIGIYASNLIPAHFFLRNFRIKYRWGGGFLLGARLSLSIAASQIAAQSGLLSEAVSNELILLAVLSCIISPIMFNQIMKGIRPQKNENSKPLEVITIDKSTIPEGWVLDQITIRSDGFVSIPLKKMKIPYDILLLSIIRDDEKIIPRGYTVLLNNDVLQVIGDSDSIQKFKWILQKE